MTPDVLTVILGGGRGTRLHPLTKDRAKPAVPLGGSYRLIDIPLSNCIYSGMHRMFVLTQFNSASLNQHLSLTYQFDQFRQGFVEVLAASQEAQTDSWYEGTADAVRRNQWHFETYSFNTYLILAGDHLYKMDYAKFIDFHEQRKADITVAVTPVPKNQASGLGLVRTSTTGRVNGFAEKPKDFSALDGFDWYGPGRKKASGPKKPRYLASMGIYVFRRKVLRTLLQDPALNDFGGDVIPRAVAKRLRVYAYPFQGYWRDIGTIKSFYDANLQLARPEAPFSFHRGGNPVFTRSRSLPGARIMDSQVDGAIVAAGASVQKCTIERSIVGLRSMVRRGSVLRHTVMMGADLFESEQEQRRSRRRKLPPLGIGPDCVIENAIIDKNARIGRGVRITNKRRVREDDGPFYSIRDGIVIVPKNAVVPNGTEI
ncbi:MAG: glucose-1-phosphate adenylyltransferase [Deltaproteobacteria bacterium]|jgi:glucose-1-phosphate adenylyltransferase|nr:glucose-1-phosphate adenylyltransferase [Deltaproteobacteria bacterium]MBW2534157.1 glucose-1-phosphate adenylyltransferase [Deltaproteobacteria bacterium]